MGTRNRQSKQRMIRRLGLAALVSVALAAALYIGSQKPSPAPPETPIPSATVSVLPAAATPAATAAPTTATPPPAPAMKLPGSSLPAKGHTVALREGLSYYAFGQQDIVYDSQGLPTLRGLMVIGLKNGSPADAARIAAALGAQVVGENRLIGQYTLQFQGLSEAAWADALAQAGSLPEVSFAMEEAVYHPESDYPPDDPWNSGLLDRIGNDLEAVQWDKAKKGDRNWGMNAVSMVKAWQLMEGRNLADVAIAVVDGPPNRSHPDMGQIYLPNIVIAGDEPFPDLESYWVEPQDAALKADWLDGADHGSHVCGIIGARTNNGIGISGIVPHARMTVLPFMNSVSFTQVLVLLTNMLEYEKEERLVMNLSLGRRYHDEVDEQTGNIIRSVPAVNPQERTAAIQAMVQLRNEGHDFLIVQSAGNGKLYYENGAFVRKALDPIYNGFFCGITRDDIQAYLADTSLSETADPDDIADRVLVVANAKLNQDGTYQLDVSSGAGATTDMAAPGTDIYSCLNTGYGLMDGTSMAAPFVTGIAANTWALAPHLTGAQIGRLLWEACVATVHDNPDGNHPTTMATKLIDAGRAAELALQMVGVPSQSPVSLSALTELDRGGVESILSFVLSGLDSAYLRTLNPDWYQDQPSQNQARDLAEITSFNGPPEALPAYAKEACVRLLVNFDTEYPYLQMDRADYPAGMPPFTALRSANRQYGRPAYGSYEVSLSAELLQQVLLSGFSFSLPPVLVSPDTGLYHYVEATGIGVPPSFELTSATKQGDILTVEGRLLDEVIPWRSSPASMPAPAPFRASFVRDSQSWANGWRLTWLTMGQQP